MSRRTQRAKARKPAPQAKPEVAVTPAASVAVAAPAEETAVDKVAALTLKNRRTFTLKGLADYLGIDRSVIEKAIKKHGYEPDRQGGKGTGNEFRIDISDFWRWHMEWLQSQQSTGGSNDGDVEDDTKLLKLAKEASLVMLVADVKARDTRLLGEFSQTIMSVSDQVSRSMTGMPKEKVNGWCDRIDGIHRDALAKLSSGFDESYVEPSVFVTVDD